MPTFALDTSGVVAAVTGNPKIRIDVEWSDLDAFTQGYIAAMFHTEHAPGVLRADWTASEQQHRSGAFPEDLGFSDLAREALALIMRDCREFQEGTYQDEAASFARTMEKLGEEERTEWPGDAAAGRALWLTHNGDDGGFFDGSWPEPHAATLGEAATTASLSVEFYLGDDGQIHPA